MNEQLCNIASKFETTKPRTNSWQRIIRCRYNLQWVVQMGTSTDLNKGYWLGLSYHTSLESLTGRYSRLEEALNDCFRNDLLKPQSIEKHYGQS